MREEHFFKTLKKILADSGEAKIGVALSGGLDSMLLAEGLRRLEVPFVALHVDHGWRGKESSGDAAWVKAWCLERDISFLAKKLDPSAAKTEAGGRQARLSFYQKIGAQKKVKEVWLGHHADDLVETFLLQLLRGAGPEGLAAMPARRTMGGLVLVRPLLDFRKSELQSLARAWKLDWREDASNQSKDYLRNRVRRQLLPYMKKISGRDPAPALARCARIISEENNYWDDLLPESWPAALPSSVLKKVPVALQRRTIKGWLVSREISDVSFDDVELVRGLLARDKPSKVNLSQNRHCRRKNGVLFIG